MYPIFCFIWKSVYIIHGNHLEVEILKTAQQNATPDRGNGPAPGELAVMQ